MLAVGDTRVPLGTHHCDLARQVALGDRPVRLTFLRHPPDEAPDEAPHVPRDGLAARGPFFARAASLVSNEGAPLAPLAALLPAGLGAGLAANLGAWGLGHDAVGCGGGGATVRSGGGGGTLAIPSLEVLLEAPAWARELERDVGRWWAEAVGDASGTRGGAGGGVGGSGSGALGGDDIGGGWAARALAEASDAAVGAEAAAGEWAEAARDAVLGAMGASSRV